MNMIQGRADREVHGTTITRIGLLAIAGGAVLAGGFYLLSGSNGTGSINLSDPEGTAIVTVKLPSELSAKAQLGEGAFNAKCMTCHGPNAEGLKGVAPPLVHKIYEPSHHGDMAFVRAAQVGVRSHHWRFGDMPPVEGLTRGDVLNIVQYVRELQITNGIE